MIKQEEKEMRDYNTSLFDTDSLQKVFTYCDQHSDLLELQENLWCWYDNMYLFYYNLKLEPLLFLVMGDVTIFWGVTNVF